MHSAKERRLDLDEKLNIGLKIHNKNIQRIREGYTGQVTLYFQNGEIVYYEPKYREQMRK